jgi:hypothetical protein
LAGRSPTSSDSDNSLNCRNQTHCDCPRRIRRAWRAGQDTAGQEEFFTLVGQPVATRTEAPPPLTPDEQQAFIAKSRSLAPRFKTDLLPPPGALGPAH